MPTVTVALAVTEESAALVAVTVYVPGCVGAVYSPAVVIVPTLAFPPVTLFTAQVMEVFEKPWIEEENCCVPLGGRNAVVGEMAPSAPTVTAALALALVSATLVAVTL